MKMSRFELWGIRRETGSGSNRRIVFSVGTEGGNKRILRTRQDVVKFLSTNPEIDLHVDEFVFKKESKDGVEEEIVKEITDKDTFYVTNDNLKRKNVEEEDVQFEAKVSRVMEKPPADPNEAFAEILPKLHEIRMKSSNPSVALSAASVTELKTILTSELDNDPIQFVKTLCKNEEIFSALQSVFFSCVEGEMLLNSVKDAKSSTMGFPPSNSKNFYCEVIEEAI